MNINLPTVTRVQLIVTACLLLVNLSLYAASDFHSLASIRMQTESFVMKYPYQSPYPPRLNMGNLDSRLRLKTCPEELSIDFARRDQIHGNTAIMVRCPIKSGWKVLMPVQIDVFDDVAVAAKPLIKGQNIDNSTIGFQKQSIARLKKGYYSKKSDFGLLEAKRNLARGAILSPSNLSPRLLVRSGQHVTLMLTYNGLQIKSSGKALQSAKLGQVVRVRNSQSNKIVEGVVAGEALVRISI